MLLAIVLRLLPRKVGAGCRLKKPSRKDDSSRTINWLKSPVIHIDFKINYLSIWQQKTINICYKNLNRLQVKMIFLQNSQHFL